MKDVTKRFGDFEMVAWGIIIIWWGLRWWPLISLPNGSGMLGTGLILLSLNAVRSLYAIPTRRHTTILGLLVLILGISLLFLEAMNVNFKIPIFEAGLILLGIFLVVRELRGGRKMGVCCSSEA